MQTFSLQTTYLYVFGISFCICMLLISVNIPKSIVLLLMLGIMPKDYMIVMNGHVSDSEGTSRETVSMFSYQPII